MAIANVTFEDPRNNFIFCYTDDYLPTNSTVSINGVNAKQSFTFTSSEGWNPSVGAFSQGVIGFKYNPNSFILGDTFVISNSAGDTTVSNYGPLPSSNLNLYFDASLNNSYSGTGTTWYDISSGGTYTGTLSSLSAAGPTFSSSNGGSFAFDGIDDLVDISNSTSLDYSNTTFTVSMWVKGNTLKTSYLIAKGLNAAAGGGGWGLYVDAYGFVNFIALNSVAGLTAFTRPSSTYVLDNVWHNIVAVVTTNTTTIASNTVSFYIDGALANGTLTQTRVYSSASTYSVNLGRKNATSAGSDYFKGNIANVQIWDKGLTAAEIFQNYNALNQRFVSGSSLVTNGLVTNLDAGNGWSYSLNSTTWKDTSGNGNNGTLQSGPKFSIVNGGCINLDGVNDYVSGSLSTLSDWTVCLWFSSNDITSASEFYPFSGTASGTGIGFGGTTNPNVWYFNDGTNIISSGSTTVTTNTWYCLVVTKSSTSYNLYTNGILTTTSTGVNLSLTQFNLGRRGDNAYYANGKIGMLTMYNRALTYSEVSKNYFNTKSRFDSYPDIFLTTKTSNLVQYVDPNNRQSYFGTGSTIADISGTGTNYTMGGAPSLYSNLNGVGGAHFLNNNSTYVRLGSSLNNRVDFTLGFWWYPNSYFNGSMRILDVNNGLTNDNGSITFSYQGSNLPFPLRLQFGFRGSSALDGFGDVLNTYVSLNTWYYAVITRSSTSSPYWNVYLNASLIYSKTYFSSYPVLGNLDFGIFAPNNPASTVYYPQGVSQAHVYDIALNLAQITQIYNNTKSRYGL